MRDQPQRDSPARPGTKSWPYFARAGKRGLEAIGATARKRLAATHLLLVALLILAAGLRLSRLDSAEFKADEAGVARQALALIHEGRFPIVGPGSSQGPTHPPMQIYLMALPFAATRDPRLAVVVIGLIHTGAVLMAFLLGHRYFNRRVGLIAAFLFAVNPWAIYYARKIWTQNWPLATTLFILALLLWVVERRPWALAGAGLALVPLVGTHLGGLAFLWVLLVLLFLFPSRVERWPLLVGGLVFLLFALPYLYHDATHDWANLRGLLGQGAAEAQMDLDAARFAAWLSSGYHFQDLAGKRYQQFLRGLPDLRWLDGLEMAFLGIGLIYLTARVLDHARRGRAHWRERAGRDMILLSWLLIPVLLQTRHVLPVYPHYFILLYPAPFLVIGLALDDGLSWSRRWLDARLPDTARPRRWARGLGLGLVAVILVIGVWQVYLVGRFFDFVARYDTPDGYGPVVGPLWRTAVGAGEAAARIEGEVLVVAQGDDPVWDNVPAALDVLLPPDRPHRLVDGEEALVYPAWPTVYAVAPGMAPTLAALNEQAGAGWVAQIETPGEEAFSLLQRRNDSRDDVVTEMTPLVGPQRLANGVELLAYAAGDGLQPDGTLRLAVAWWYDQAKPPEKDYHSFAHLVDAVGKKWGQHDLVSFPSHAWRPGDVVVTYFGIAVEEDTPAGEYWVRLGMYSYPEIVNAPLLNVAGDPVADAVVIGPIVLP